MPRLGKYALAPDFSRTRRECSRVLSKVLAHDRFTFKISITRIMHIACELRRSTSTATTTTTAAPLTAAATIASPAPRSAASTMAATTAVVAVTTERPLWWATRTHRMCWRAKAFLLHANSLVASRCSLYKYSAVIIKSALRLIADVHALFKTCKPLARIPRARVEHA